METSKSVTEILQDVIDDMCLHCCKYGVNETEMSDEEFDAHCKEFCKNCPLEKL